jgi:hypothetical protein
VLLNVRGNFWYATDSIMMPTDPTNSILNQIFILYIGLAAAYNEQYQISEMSMTIDARQSSFPFTDRFPDKSGNLIGSQPSHFGL